MFNQLFPFQKRVVRQILKQKSLLVAAEQGTGKTYISGGLISKLMGSKMQVLVVCPLSNLESSWVKTLRSIPDLNIFTSLDEDVKVRAPYVYIVHYEAVEDLLPRLRETEWTAVIYDESQRIKDKGSKQSRNAAKLTAEYRIGLSGTPIDKAPQDLWAQFRFVQPDVFGKRWADFDNHFLRPTGYMGYERKFREERRKEFMQKIRPYVVRLTKEQVLDLPPIDFVECPVTMKGEQLRIYTELEKQMLAEMGDRVVTAGLKVTQLGKQQQVCGGFVIDDEDEVIEVGRAKLRKLKTLLQRRVTFPVVVFCRYIQELNYCKEAALEATDSVGMLYGKTPKKERARLIEEFQDGKIDVLICQIKTGGVGIDLYRASNAIFYSCTFSYIDHEQALARIHRHGQTEPVTIYTIYVENSIDSDVYEAIKNKGTVAEAVLSRLKGIPMAKKVLVKKAKKATKKTEKKATKKAAAAPKKTTKKAAKKTEEQPKKKRVRKGRRYGPADLAKKLGIGEAGARARLRRRGVPLNASRRYDWDRAEFYEVLEKVR